MSKEYTGHCACGAVRFEFDTDPSFIANCHCTDCKRARDGREEPPEVGAADIPQFERMPS